MSSFKVPRHFLKSFPASKWWQDTFSDVAGVCFDMDGTLLDSEPLHGQALWDLVSRGEESINFKGKVYKSAEDFHPQFIGLCDEEVCHLLQKDGLWSHESSTQDFINLKNNYLIKQLDQATLETSLRPEALVFLDFLHFQGTRCALVSASQKVVVHSFLERLGISNKFSVILGAEDTSETKPSALPYLKACELLGLSPQQCVAFEDSPTGYESARKAGLVIVKAEWF